MTDAAGERTTRDTEELQRRMSDMKMELDGVRSDLAATEADRTAELEMTRAMLEGTREECKQREKEIAELARNNKELKAQNLSLQYQLNLWGIPVELADRDAVRGTHGAAAGAASFFPPLTPLDSNTDPIPVVLRGDLRTFFFPDLIHFLGNSNLLGVLTVISDGIVSKLFLNRGILKLASWNNLDQDQSLKTVLIRAKLAPEKDLEAYGTPSRYDLDTAFQLLREKRVTPTAVQRGLRQQARNILGYLFQLNQGSFFFQPGRIDGVRDLEFSLPIIDTLLKTAAEVDEKTRELARSHV